ncbi:MAG: putative Xaa-Pro aminopeptidase [Clostridiales bacterium]|jgi:Xaa-Pro aminopeptidase|nr:putative Xaa-Pro aminopeptidase [Clostridiales bacterium]
MNKEFYVLNRKRLMEGIEDNSVVIIFAGEAPHMSADASYDFVPNRNFLYLTGIDRDQVILIMTKHNGKVEETLFIEESDPIMAKWVGERISKEEALEASGVEEIQFLSRFESSVNMLGTANYENLYLDLERRSWDSMQSTAQLFGKNIVEKYPSFRVKNIYNAIRDMRMVKSSGEIECIKKAIGITYEGIKSMMLNAKPGMYEYELEAYFDFELKRRGVKKHAFDTIAASGANGTVLHYVANNSKIGGNDLILFDLGAQYNYYCGDISRTFPVTGEFTDRQREVYNVVLRALNETTKAIKPGIPFSKLNEVCKKVLTEGCKELGLIREDSEISKYYYHGVSHFLGLDTHDVGVRDVDLKPGMVLTVEPGLYIEEEKIGIRIEDNVVVTETGHEVLSKDIIRTAEEIEEFMKK